MDGIAKLAAAQAAARNGSGPPPLEDVEPRSLAEVVETFERWQYLPDPGVVIVPLATVAANLLPGDPVWSVLVGPPGAGKSEALQSTIRLPDVHSDHAGKVGAVVGHVDPRIAFETERGLEVSGTLDISTELGRRVYSLVKSHALSWSIGYVVPKGGRRRKGELDELVEIDLAEISAVPVPANEGARTLSIKSIPPVQLVSFDVA